MWLFRGRRHSIKRDAAGRSARQRAFELFGEGQRPSQVYRTIGIPARTAFRYFETFKKLRDRIETEPEKEETKPLKEALEKAVAERPDLILMDRSLPKIDGYEVTRRLKNRDEFKDIPIVALTAHAMRGDREKALEAGCEGYISKPINVRELPELIMSYLRGKRESILGGEER